MFRGPPCGPGGLQEPAGREAKWGRLSGAQGAEPHVTAHTPWTRGSVSQASPDLRGHGPLRR